MKKCSKNNTLLTKRIIPCLDVKNNQVVKGVQFKSHRVVGNILDLAQYYCAQGADELVFYDIAVSAENKSVNLQWVSEIAKILTIPFCVAGGIRSLETAQKIIASGADKISLNSPALENPALIDELAKTLGTQCVVIGIDSYYSEGEYYVYQYTGDEKKMRATSRKTQEWIQEVQARGAGEVVLNCMNQDGMRNGYAINQLFIMQENLSIPLIASGGAGSIQDFIDVFQKTKVDGALAASVFHQQHLTIPELKQQLHLNNIEIRL